MSNPRLTWFCFDSLIMATKDSLCYSLVPPIAASSSSSLRFPWLRCWFKRLRQTNTILHYLLCFLAVLNPLLRPWCSCEWQLWASSIQCAYSSFCKYMMLWRAHICCKLLLLYLILKSQRIQHDTDWIISKFLIILYLGSGSHITSNNLVNFAKYWQIADLFVFSLEENNSQCPRLIRNTTIFNNN